MKPTDTSSVGDAAPGNSAAWYRSTLALGLAGSVLLWAALPPLAFSPLAWIAPVPWLMLVHVKELSGRRPYRTLWLAGFIYWLLVLQWVRLAHPAVYLGWFVLSAYLGVYLPAFIGLARVAVHRLRVPLWLAAPIVWTGLELARAHLFTGFLMGSLAHSQVHFAPLIQISDVAGEYAVDFVIVLVAAAVTDFGFRISNCGLKKWRTAVAPLIVAVLVFAATLFYGHTRLSGSGDANSQSEIRNPKSVRVALIQGNSLADWRFDDAKQREIMAEYVAQSDVALAKAKSTGDGRPIDLVIWPESTFRSGLREFDSNFRLPPGTELSPEEILAAGPRNLAALVKRLDTPVLVGIDRLHFFTDPAAPADEPHFRAYNSCALVNRSGKIIGTYDKTHLVMFGEYIPFADWFPTLYRLLPMTGGTNAGDGPVALCLDDVCFAPNICYETTIPHVIRGQVVELLAANKVPDVLVNITNDSWYWGSSELDLHLACDVFRAVETRKPMVIAANGGISAWIDAYGRIRAQSPRQTPDVIIADVERGSLTSYYVRFGDWFAEACLTCCIFLAIVVWRQRSRV
jgi:apolipoprotein N-acyltransferase